MEFLLMGFLFFVGIVGLFSMISFLFGSAFEAGGWLGIVVLILFVIILCVLISTFCGNDGEDIKK